MGSAIGLLLPCPYSAVTVVSDANEPDTSDVMPLLSSSLVLVRLYRLKQENHKHGRDGRRSKERERVRGQGRDHVVAQVPVREF